MVGIMSKLTQHLLGHHRTTRNQKCYKALDFSGTPLSDGSASKIADSHRRQQELKLLCCLEHAGRGSEIGKLKRHPTLKELLG